MKIRNIAVALAALGSIVEASNLRHGPGGLHVYRQANDNGDVTFDQYSLSVQGQRVVFFSGEFHPFRLPVPGLWRDVFEKIRAMGYNGVTFYINWALLEGKQGTIQTPEGGAFDYQPFFDAAKETGIWLNARPGPYINAEVSGGGFPGWQKRNSAALRTDQSGYLNTTNLYMSTIGALIAKNQITHGGPVILVQPENEYTYANGGVEADYMAFVEQQLRNAGITVPLMSNDAYPAGYFAPGSGTGAVDIYGYDAYPLGFNCGNPSNWGSNSLPTNYASLHSKQSPNTPNSIVEFQGGSFDPWGGPGFEKCAELLNWQFENVFYKNDFSMGVKMLSLYMTYGGFNWGNIGYDTGYSSYDYGAPIALDRTITRQKYAEAKLIANAMRASPAFLTGVAQSNSNGQGAYTKNKNIFTSGVFDSASNTKFWFQRQSNYASTSNVSYNITLPTSQGNITIPQLGGQLAIYGRTSPMSVTDYNVGGTHLLYSSADLFTWQQNGKTTTLVVYGDDGQTHEFAVQNVTRATQIQGSGAKIQNRNNAIVVNLQVGSRRQIIQFNNGLNVHVVDRHTAYGYWVINPTGFTSANLPIVNMPTGYLVRNVQISGSTATITGDLNQTSIVEVIGVPGINMIVFNGNRLSTTVNSQTGIASATVSYSSPSLSIPDLHSVRWSQINGLPEISPGYDDSKWPKADLTYTNNTNRGLNTPTSLYAADYGFHAGSLIYRGHFVANGNETQLQLSPQGGNGFGYALWLNGTFIGNWLGDGGDYYHYGNFSLPKLTPGANYVFTVVVDHMGNQENYQAGGSDMKQPRGVMQYTLNTQNGNSVPDSTITWKVTGNLGGESYYETELGPLNEGGFYAERQGYYLPGAPTSSWDTSGSPQAGIKNAGVQFYSTTFNLNFPTGYDIPLSLNYGDNSISNTCPIRVLMWVNGYQFGKYVSNIGPQTLFPVPEGVWNYRGSNTVAIQVWALTTCGGAVPKLQLTAGTPIQNDYGAVSAAPQPTWTARAGSYETGRN